MCKNSYEQIKDMAIRHTLWIHTQIDSVLTWPSLYNVDLYINHENFAYFGWMKLNLGSSTLLLDSMSLTL